MAGSHPRLNRSHLAVQHVFELVKETRWRQQISEDNCEGKDEDEGENEDKNEKTAG